jgi:cell division protein DivIC
MRKGLAAARARFHAMRLSWLPQAVIFLLLLGLVGAMAIEPTRQLLEQRKRISGMETDLQRIERSNDKLQDRIKRLQDPDFLEQEAREQIGLVRPGETAIVVMPPSRRAQLAKQQRRQAAKPPPPPPPEPGFIEGLLEFISWG